MMANRFNRRVFFEQVRESLFRGSMSQSQVDGMNQLLDVWDEYYARKGWPLDELGYDLATAFHETARTMQPIQERGGKKYFNRYDIRHNPRKAKELGNTSPGDGYRYRGEGHVQNTGKRNARFSSQRLNEEFGLNVDFVADPNKRGDPFLSAHCLFLGNHEGWWTGKPLTRYVNGKKRDFKNARRVVNGTDRAALIAGYAETFCEELDVAVAAAPTPIPDLPEDPSEPVFTDDLTTGKPLGKSTTFWSAIGGFITTAVTAVSQMPWQAAVVLIIVVGGCTVWIVKERKLKSLFDGV